MSKSTCSEDSKEKDASNRPNHASQSESPSSSTGEHTHTATIYRDTSGKVRGVAVWIDCDQLEKAGIDLADTSGVEFRITNDGLQLTGVSDDD
jgi:hypothetical protein